MSVIPCSRNQELRRLIREFSEVLRTDAYTLGSHGLSKDDFYNSGIFRGAIERVRGQFAAGTREKRAFAENILDHMKRLNSIREWRSAGSRNRHDYSVELSSGRTAVIELKGCLDGNNTTIFERPAHAQEFIIWSICTNLGADPRLNVWSGLHARVSSDIIERHQRVDGVMIWDMMCGTVGRPCPKLQRDPERKTDLGGYHLPPPCIYVLPATIASPRNNPHPVAQSLGDVQVLSAFHRCFSGRDEDVNYVDFEIRHEGAETERRTRIRRGGDVVRESEFVPIRRA